jgi:hypothetical protein
MLAGSFTVLAFGPSTSVCGRRSGESVLLYTATSTSLVERKDHGYVPHLLDYKTGRYLVKYRVPEISPITEKVN